jgi:hypothetical protein
MRWFWQDKNPDVVDFIKKTLFPPIIRRVEDGTEFFIDRAVDTNLEVVYHDLQEGHCDEMTLNTLRFAIDQLQKVRNRYNIHYPIKSDQTTSFYMVSANES